MPQSLGAPGGISFSLSGAVVENGPDKLKLIPQGIQQPPETELPSPGLKRLPRHGSLFASKPGLFLAAAEATLHTTARIERINALIACQAALNRNALFTA